MMKQKDQIFLNRLNQRTSRIAWTNGSSSKHNMVDNETGNFTKANDAEQYAIDELRKMGNDILHC